MLIEHFIFGNVFMTLLLLMSHLAEAKDIRWIKIYLYPLYGKNSNPKYDKAL